MGTAGVGKSFLIRALETGIWNLVKSRYGAEKYPNVRTAVRLAAFTGKAAYQVGGVTLHSLLSIGDIHNLKPLSGNKLQQLQNDLENTHFLFIDEMSMVSLNMLMAIDSRLRVIFPQRHDQPFGGVSVVGFRSTATSSRLCTLLSSLSHYSSSSSMGYLSL